MISKESQLEFAAVRVNFSGDPEKERDKTSKEIFQTTPSA